MPIKVPYGLPATQQLLREGVFVMDEARATTQDIRPLQIAVLNLMPEKMKAEMQLARLIGNSPLQCELTLFVPDSYVSKNTSAEHLIAFYKRWNDVRPRTFDALVITGAPVENMPFEEVSYWTELKEIFDWSVTHVFSTLTLCWAAQAALYHFHGIPKRPCESKLFGLYPYKTVSNSARTTLLRGFDDVYMMPVSRHTRTAEEDVRRIQELEIVAASDKVGVGMITEAARRYVFMLNHLEYDATTLNDEYVRDLKAGDPIEPPCNYFPDNDPHQAPLNVWRAHANLLFGNWINDVYQRTPYDLAEIPALAADYMKGRMA